MRGGGAPARPLRIAYRHAAPSQLLSPYVGGFGFVSLFPPILNLGERDWTNTLLPRPELTTILFTDLVSSTELMQHLGDAEAQQVFHTHYQFLRDTIVMSGGNLVEWTGDGVMATFSVVSDAIRCAIAIQRTAPRGAAYPPLTVRAGLNVGEILRQEMGSGYFGTPLVIARRLCDRAVAGQILCSGTVAGLVAGSPTFRFRELGKLQLKGIAESLLVSEVIQERTPPSSRSLHELRSFLQALPDIVVATDELGLVVFFNQGAEEVLGYSSDEIVGRPVWEVYQSLDEAKRLMAAIRDPNRDGPGRVSTHPTTLLTKSGREVPVLISAAANETVGTIGVARVHRPALPACGSGA